MMSTDYDSIEGIIRGLDFVGAAVEGKSNWERLWLPVIERFVDIEVNDMLELANMLEHYRNPLAKKKEAIFRSKCSFQNSC